VARKIAKTGVFACFSLNGEFRKVNRKCLALSGCQHDEASSRSSRKITRRRASSTPLGTRTTTPDVKRMDLRGVSRRRSQRGESEQSQALAPIGQFRWWLRRSTARGPKRWSRRGGVTFATDRTKVRRHPRRGKTGGSTSPMTATVPTLLPTPPTVAGCSPCHGPPQPTSAWTPSHHQQRSTCIRRTLTLIGQLMPHWPRTGRWRGSADGNARLISRLGASRRLIGWFGANDRLIGRLMPHSPRTGR
jgi:hypothetical protein